MCLCRRPMFNKLSPSLNGLHHAQQQIFLVAHPWRRSRPPPELKGNFAHLVALVIKARQRHFLCFSVGLSPLSVNGIEPSIPVAFFEARRTHHLVRLGFDAYLRYAVDDCRSNDPPKQPPQLGVPDHDFPVFHFFPSWCPGAFYPPVRPLSPRAPRYGIFRHSGNASVSKFNAYLTRVFSAGNS